MTPRTVFLACAAVAALQLPARRPGPAAGAPPPPGCPAPAAWAAIRDDSWPRLAHADGDAAWAHLEPEGLPARTATWCNPLDRVPYAWNAGRTIYAQHCAMCHGAEGVGDGPGAGVSLPLPYDFTTPAFAGMREPPGAAVLYAIVARGIDSTAMRAFPELGPWERLAVLAYVTRFPGDSALRAQRAWADTLRSRRPH